MPDMLVLKFPTETSRATAELILQGFLSFTRLSSLTLEVDVQNREVVKDLTRRMAEGWWVFTWTKETGWAMAFVGGEQKAYDEYAKVIQFIRQGRVVLAHGNVQVKAQQDGVPFRRI